MLVCLKGFGLAETCRAAVASATKPLRRTRKTKQDLRLVGLAVSARPTQDSPESSLTSTPVGESSHCSRPLSDPLVLSPSDTILHRTVTALSIPSGPGNDPPSGGSSSSWCWYDFWCGRPCSRPFLGFDYALGSHCCACLSHSDVLRAASGCRHSLSGDSCVPRRTGRKTGCLA